MKKYFEYAQIIKLVKVQSLSKSFSKGLQIITVLFSESCTTIDFYKDMSKRKLCYISNAENVEWKPKTS